LVRAHTDGAGRLLSEEFIAEQGGTIAGVSAPIFQFNRICSSSNGLTAVILVAGVNLLWVEGAVVLRGQDPGPDPGTSISDIWDCSVNAQGRWAATVDLNTGENIVLVDGVPVMRGDQRFLPHRVTALQGLRLTDRGDVFYAVRLSNGKGAICVNDEVLIEDEVTELNGQAVFGPGVFGLDEVADPSGTHIFFKGGLGVPLLNLAAVVPLDLSDTYCAARPSSSGTVPILGIFGALYPELGRTKAFARDLPPNTAAILIAGQNQTFLPGAGGAFGALCIGGPFLRSPAITVETDGTLDVNLATIYSGPTGPAPGTTWNFQLWYRDVDSVVNADASPEHHAGSRRRGVLDTESQSAGFRRACADG
jgi:hypothetical protein